MAGEARHDAARQRYELATEGGTAIAAYRREGGVLDFTHTEVPEAMEGQGIGTQLVAGALADVRAEGSKMRASCPFVAAYVERHPEVRDLLAG